MAASHTLFTKDYRRINLLLICNANGTFLPRPEHLLYGNGYRSVRIAGKGYSPRHYTILLLDIPRVQGPPHVSHSLERRSGMVSTL